MLNPDILNAPLQGYRDSINLPDTFLQLSRNFSVAPDMPARRRGFVIRRKMTPAPAAGTYMERLPVDELDGTLQAAFQYGTTLYWDKATPTSIKTGLVNPLTAKRKPQWVHMLGRCVRVDGTNFGVVIHDGTTMTYRDPLPDGPDNTVDGVTISAVAGGAMTVPPVSGVMYVRIRYYDEKTGTYSGPNDRTGTTDLSVTLSGGTQTVRINGSAVSVPARASHVQIQFAPDTDAPSSYEVSNENGDASGLITKAAFTAGNIDYTADPDTGLAFEFRTDDLQSVYRHSNPPTSASMVAEFRGRLFFATHTDTWLVWSETDNPEHFYHEVGTEGSTTSMNSIFGDGGSNAATGPITALGATEIVLCIFTRTSLMLGEGSWQPTFNSDTGNFQRRDMRITPLTQNTRGAVSPDVEVVGQELYFIAQDGPSVFGGQGAVPIDPEAITQTWVLRDWQYEGLYSIGYDPNTRLIHFAFVTTATNADDGVLDTMLVWHPLRAQWCPPWDLHVTSMTLHRLTTDAGVNRGARLLAGGPYGTINELNFGDGDGVDTDDNEFDPQFSTSDTTESVTVSTAAWTTDEWQGFGLVLVDRGDDTTYYRTIRSNTGTVISWDGVVTDSGSGWELGIAGIDCRMHLAAFPGIEGVLRRVKALLDDQVARRT
jgi:hypothetical protein